MLDLNDMFSHLTDAQLIEAAVTAWQLGETGMILKISAFLHLAGAPELSAEVAAMVG